ncbi:MAG: hypothetical protein FIA99_10565 [Ruminiclostridium sp.]|nr:hypothetical protein [Ruminiclostridium sp.]
MLKIVNKKGISLIMLFILFTVLFSGIQLFSPVTVSAATVSNDSFESADAYNNPVSWTVVTGADYYDGATVVSTIRYSGVKSLELYDTDSAKAVGVRSGYITTTVGKLYEAKVYTYLSSGSSVSLYLEFWDNSNNRLAETHVNLTNTGSWQELAVTGIAPSGSTKATILCYSPVSNTGASYFDLVSFGQGRLMPNGNMEASYANFQPLEWEFDLANGTDSGYLSSTRAYSGSYSVCLDDSSASTGIPLRSPYLVATAGTTYTGSSYIFNESGAGWFYLEFWDANKTRLAETHAVSSGTGSWQKYTVTATAPANTVAVTLLFYSSSANTGKSYFDDAYLEGATMKYAYTLDIASKKQFFADSYITETIDNNVARTTNPGTKHGSPVIVPDKTWEGAGTNWPFTYLYGTVIYDSQASIYKMWYQAYYDPAGKYFVCYATSSDGITWTKPNLGVYSFNGNTNNNIVGTQHAQSVYKDMAESDPNKRYKMYAYQMSYDTSNPGYYIWYSSDGINWSLPYTTPRIDSDDVTTMAYDSTNSKFITGNKFNVSGSDGHGRRTQRTSTSTDFINWTTPKLAFQCDEIMDKIGYLRTDIYGMGLYPTDGIYFGFPWIFYHTEDRGSAEDGPVNTQLAFSRDGARWVRPSRVAVIPNGAAGSFDAGSIYTASSPITVGNNIRMYYGGATGTHDPITLPSVAKIDFTEWRKDGFVSLNTGSTEGTVVTKTLKFTGSALYLNAYATGGSIKVEILDSSGNVKTGYSKTDCTAITTDNLNHTVYWGGSSNISSLAGQSIKLKFYMTTAKLYSFTFN